MAPPPNTPEHATLDERMVQFLQAALERIGRHGRLTLTIHEAEITTLDETRNTKLAIKK